MNSRSATKSSGMRNPPALRAICPTSERFRRLTRFTLSRGNPLIWLSGLLRKPRARPLLLQTAGGSRQPARRPKEGKGANEHHGEDVSRRERWASQGGHGEFEPLPRCVSRRTRSTSNPFRNGPEGLSSLRVDER